ncbi:BnaA01g22940D [Brassica napus]|uniref:BnaA01g22940D protein n=1 Tax=Brassica napus TaxID=3708 RepID=A0A078ID97_BRANA|nr:BnaA01g22940D [Brassica napus]
MYSLTLQGRRSLDLHKCMRRLRVAVNPLQNAYSSASAAQDGGKGKIFTVSYMVDSLGFTTKLAESTWRKVSSDSESKGNPDSSRGASTSELTAILSKVPKILRIKKDKAFSRYYDFAKEVIEADKSFKKVPPESCLREGSRQENKLRNILVLRDLGVPQKLLFSLLVSNFQTVTGKERFEETLKKVLEMGFDPTTSKFVQALNAVYQLSDKTTQEKVDVFCTRLGFSAEHVWEVFKKYPNLLKVSENKILNFIETLLGLGFTRDEVMVMVKCFPRCITHSTTVVKEKVEFVVKQMNWPVKAVSLFPRVVGYSMDKRIVPRCNVIKALMSKGLLGTGELPPPMGYVFICSDEVFLKRLFFLAWLLRLTFF